MQSVSSKVKLCFGLFNCEFVVLYVFVIWMVVM